MRYILYNVKNLGILYMTTLHPQRAEAIRKLNEYFSEFDSVHCTEHAVSVESGIVGFAHACELLNAITPEEHAQIRSCLLKCRHKTSIPAFLNTTLTQANLDKINTHQVELALNMVNQLMAQSMDLQTAISFAIFDYEVTEQTLLSAYENQKATAE